MKGPLKIVEDICRSGGEKMLILIQALTISGFYGKLTISFENGKIVLLRKEETIKP